MIVFRDMTYCTREDCANENCRRRLDQDVQKCAARAGLPLSLSDFGPVCKDYRKKDEK
jgi:hypothetical protein